MSKTGNSYPEEFRRDAVELLRSSGRSITQVARELGVNVNSLRTWRDRSILGQGFGAVDEEARAGASAEDLLEENKRLRRENEYLRRQREIQKKRQHPQRGPAAGHALIDQMRAHDTVIEICEALDLSRSGYDKSIGSQPSERQRDNGDLLKEMKMVHNEGFKRAYGSPRMTIELQRRGLSCSENRVARLLSKAGMKAKYKTAFRPKTTVQNPARLPAPNRHSKAPAPARPGEVLVSDITYGATTLGWMSQAVTLAIFSRQVAGWHLALSMETALAIQAARKVSSRGGGGQDTIYHSNRGWPIHQCRDALLDQGSGGRSKQEHGRILLDNAACESCFATLKREAFPANGVLPSKAEARRTIFDSIKIFYNQYQYTPLEKTSLLRSTSQSTFNREKSP